MTHDTWTAAANARIDWARLLEDIAYLLGEPVMHNPEQRTPCDKSELARQLKIPRGTLRNWLDGSEPRHSDGEAILAHWCRLTGKARTFVPVDRYVLSASKIAAKTGSDKPRASGGMALHAVCMRWAG